MPVALYLQQQLGISHTKRNMLTPKTNFLVILIGLLTMENCLAFNIGPWVKLAAIKSRNFHKLSKITKQTSIKENLELTPTMKTVLNKVNNYRTRSIISRGLNIFYPIYCGLYWRAVNITDNLWTKQGNYSIFEPKIRGL